MSRKKTRVRNNVINTPTKEKIVYIKVADEPEVKPEPKTVKKVHTIKISNKKMAVLGAIGAVVVMSTLEDFGDKAKEVNESPKYNTEVIQNNNYNTKQEILRNNPLKVDANEILNAYSSASSYAETEAIDTLYRDKYVQVTGEVKAIEDEYVILNNDNPSKWYSEWVNLQCEIVDINELKGIDIGDTVVVNGYCVGEDGLKVEIENCDIIEIQP